MAIALAAATTAFSVASGAAKAADLPVKAAKSPPADLHFFLLIDDRITLLVHAEGHRSWQFLRASRRHDERAGAYSWRLTS
jgi:hypothetical protein